MKNFPESVATSLDRYSKRGKPFSDRILRLDVAVEAVWRYPDRPEAVQGFHRRLNKFLNAINDLRILNSRFEVKAPGLKPMSHRASDKRPTVALDPDDIMSSFAPLEAMFTQPPTRDQAAVLRATGIALLTFFVVSLYRRALNHWRDRQVPFPTELCQRLEKLFAERGSTWCRDTLLRERLKAVAVIIAVAETSPDNRTQVMETSRLLRSHPMPELLPREVAHRVMLCELYHRVWPFIMGKRSFHSLLIKEQDAVLNDLARLVEEIVAQRKLGDQLSPESLAVCRKIEARLARSIGIKNDDLGWQVYRLMRSDRARPYYRSDYIFRELLPAEKDRLAVVNSLYRNKKSSLPPTDPQRERAHEIIIEKYQPYFRERLGYDPETDSILILSGEEPVRLNGS